MLLSLILFGLILGAVSPSDGQQVGLQRSTCPMFWYRFNGHCYKYVAARMSWGDAELHCVSEGANLVSIHSLDEQNVVRGLIKNSDPDQGWTWIGLHKEGRWMWSDGCAVDFVFWNAGEPNNLWGNEHCAHNNIGTDLKWNDNVCSKTFPFVCASRTVCP